MARKTGRPLRVKRFFGDLLPNGRELFRGNNYRGVIAALDLALVSPLEGGADSDDPMGGHIFSLRYV